MGQQALIIVALSSLLVGLSVLGFMGAWDYSNETTASLFEREQAINVTRSGVNMALSNLRQQKTWRDGFSDMSIAGGTVTVRIEDIGVDTVRVIAAGRINNVTHNSMLEAKLSSIFPTVESALTVFGDSVEVTSDGKSFLIDGNDYNIDGSAGSAPAVEGIGVQSDKSVQDVKYQLENASGGSISDCVIGKSGVGSVGSFSSSNLSELHAFYRDLATITMAAGKYSDNRVIGTLEKPEIVYVPGDLEWGGTITGSGILVVDGQLIMKGKIEWKGIILTMSGDVQIELGGSGTPNILGTVWVGNNTADQVTNVHLSGNPGVRYSYQTLTTILGNLGLLEVEIIKYYE